MWTRRNLASGFVADGVAAAFPPRGEFGGRPERAAGIVDEGLRDTFLSASGECVRPYAVPADSLAPLTTEGAVQMESIRRLAAAPSATALRWLTLDGRLALRTAILGLALASVSTGVLLSWDWLVAAGLSSLVVGVLPCVAMCAAGLCMGHGSKGTARAATKDVPSTPAAPDKP